MLRISSLRCFSSKKHKRYCYLSCLKHYLLLLLQGLWRGFLWSLLKREDQDLIRTFGLNLVSFYMPVLPSVPKVNIPYHKVHEKWHLWGTLTAKSLCFINGFCAILQDHKTYTNLQSYMQIQPFLIQILLDKPFGKHQLLFAFSSHCLGLAIQPLFLTSRFLVQQYISFVCSELHCLHKKNIVFNPQ